MQHREHDDPFGFDLIEDGIGKPRHDHAAHVSVDSGEHLRELLERREARVRRSQELLAEPTALRLIPAKRVGQIASGLPPNDES